MAALLDNRSDSETRRSAELPEQGAGDLKQETIDSPAERIHAKTIVLLVVSALTYPSEFVSVSLIVGRPSSVSTSSKSYILREWAC
jgi:hypothetical protein